jgi:MOSC domain-containing protein YiiM
MTPGIVSVNVGRPRLEEWRWRGRPVKTAICKEPVSGPVLAEGVNLAGDDQADRRIHGGPDKAVYAYALEDYEWWAGYLGRTLPPGTFGENLTTVGIDVTNSGIGDRWRVGGAVLEVTQPRDPCFKLALRMGEAGFGKQFNAARRPGAYLRIVEPGLITGGDPITVVGAAPPALRIADLFVDELTPDLLQRIVADERVADGWRRGAARTLERLGLA